MGNSQHESNSLCCRVEFGFCDAVGRRGGRAVAAQFAGVAGGFLEGRSRVRRDGESEDRHVAQFHSRAARACRCRGVVEARISREAACPAFAQQEFLLDGGGTGRRGREAEH